MKLQWHGCSYNALNAAGEAENISRMTATRKRRKGREAKANNSEKDERERGMKG
ncbi:347_t:CDS:2 [Acaulospora colombiana]|uniref:347_t:CDS:1 n=1 Tax=Acaulospora colombiana TaxID=27376 RepID=A0ACA9MWS3_9GLOM|nr:347_t:CDS:2 [Acaulospora colombiana]